MPEIRSLWILLVTRVLSENPIFHLLVYQSIFVCIQTGNAQIAAKWTDTQVDEKLGFQKVL